METVMVLMSTYNGEKYIDEQLESLFNQTNINVEVLVRDDGSCDNTLKILKKWSTTHKLTWYQGENLKPAYSFLDLVKKAPKRDWYAYCDQDDVWYLDKLYEAVSRLNKLNSDEINLYVSTYDVVDSNLELLSVRNMNYDIPFTMESTIIDRCPSGCTMVFNNTLKEKLASLDPKFIRMHDYWTLLVVKALEGNVVTDNSSRMMYRQHENNTVGLGKGTSVRIKRLFKSAFKGNHERQRQAISLLDSLYDDIPLEKKASLELMKNYRDSPIKTLKLLFNKSYRTISFKQNVLFKLSVFMRLF